MKRFLNSFQCPSVVYETSGQQEETNRPDKHRCLPKNLSQTQYSQSQLYSETIWGSLPGCPRGWWCLGCKSGCTPRVVPSSLPGNMEQKPADLQEMSQYTADDRLPRTIWPWHKHFLLGLYCRTSTAENGECRLWIPCGAFPAAEELQENSSHRTWARAPSCLLLA